MASTSKDLLNCTGEKPSIIESILLKKKQSLRGSEWQGKLLTTSVPPSQFLGKAKDFLGVLAKANEKLEQDAQETCRSKYDIEVLDGCEQDHIEMDLLLGVTDLHTADAVAAAEAAMSGFQSKSLCDSTDSGSSSDTGYESEDDNDGRDRDATVREEEELQKSNSDEPLTKNRPEKRPKIVVLN